MRAPDIPRICGIYTRISEDDGGRLGVIRQEQDGREEASDRGWPVFKVYVENDVSATRSKVRPEFEQMLADVHAGLINAIIIFDTDRLTRSPREAEDLIDLYDQLGVLIVSLGGYRDLSTPNGRRDFRNDVVNAKYETDKMSKRIRRQKDQAAAQGRPVGFAGFGFERVDGRDVIVPAEAAVVRELADRVLAGESVRSLCKELNQRGVRSRFDKQWQSATIRQLLLRPSLAGLRVHRGTIVGPTNGDAILTHDQRDRLVALFHDPSRRHKTHGREPSYLLSSLAVCGRKDCPGRMRHIVGWVGKDGSRTMPAYTCNTCFRIRRLQSAVDDYVRDVIIERLSRPDAADLFSRGDAVKVREAREAQAAVEARMASAADAFAEGSINAEQLKRITAKLRDEDEMLTRTVMANVPVSIPSDALGANARGWWDQATLAQRRAAIDALAVVRIMPTTVGAPFNEDDIVVDWR